MSGVSRLAVAAFLAASFGNVAYAQSHARRNFASPDRYYALFENHRADLGQEPVGSGAVPPSESHTVMGLRVPR